MISIFIFRFLIKTKIGKNKSQQKQIFMAYKIRCVGKYKTYFEIKYLILHHKNQNNDCYPNKPCPNQAAIARSRNLGRGIEDQAHSPADGGIRSGATDFW